MQILNAFHNKFIPNMFYVHGFDFGKFHLLIFIILYKNTRQPAKLRSEFRCYILGSVLQHKNAIFTL